MPWCLIPGDHSIGLKVKEKQLRIESGVGSPMIGWWWEFKGEGYLTWRWVSWVKFWAECKNR